MVRLNNSSYCKHVNTVICTYQKATILSCADVADVVRSFKFTSHLPVKLGSDLVPFIHINRGELTLFFKIFYVFNGSAMLLY